jgi:hypothetical protein
MTFGGPSPKVISNKFFFIGSTLGDQYFGYFVVQLNTIVYEPINH